MANWSNPTLTSLYTDFVTEVKNRDVDLALGLDPATTSPTNVPTNAIRWNSANSRWEKYTSGSWGTLTATYALTSLSLTGSITFEGATDDAFETTLTVADPTADRTITLPNVSGTVVTTGDTGSITSTMIADGAVVNADVNASAAIAGTKISPDFGSQNVTTTGTSTAAGFIPSSATVPSNGLYLPAANQLGFSTASTSRLVVDASGNVNIDSGTFYVDAVNNRVGVGTTGPSQALTVNGNIETQNAGYVRSVGTGSDSAGAGPNIGVNSSSAIYYIQQLNASNGLDFWYYNAGWNKRLTLDASGNLGLGVVPSTWGTGGFMNIAGGAGVFSTGNGLFTGSNAYYNANWKYASANAASYYYQVNGTHQWHTSTNTPSTNGVITFTQAMTLDASGNLGIGATSPQSALDIASGVYQSVRTYLSSITDTYHQFRGTPDGVGYEHARVFSGRDTSVHTYGSYLAFYTEGKASGTTDTSFERARIDSSGRLLVGTSSWTGSSTNIGGIQITSSNYVAGGQVTGLLGSWRASANDNNGGADVGIDYYRVPRGGGVQSGTEMRFYTGFSYLGGTYQRMTLDQDGRLLVGTSSTSDSAKFLMQGNAVDSGGGAIINLCNGKATPVNGEATGIIRFSDNTHAEAVTIMAARDGGTWSASSKPTRLVFSTTADGAASPTERMRIGNTGDVWFNTASASPTADPGVKIISSATIPEIRTVVNTSNGGITCYSLANTNATYNGYRFYVKVDGGIANVQVNDVNLSDRNVKKDIAPASTTWDCLKAWEIVNYRYKDQPDNAALNLGVIAQQVAESCPEVITVFQEAKEATEDQPAQEERLGVKEQQMYWIAIKALQEAQVRIETLEAKVAALESR